MSDKALSLNYYTDRANEFMSFKNKKGFTNKYNINKLVCLEEFNNAYDAISREKQIKGGSRKKKIELVENNNKEWKDLSKDWP